MRATAPYEIAPFVLSDKLMWIVLSLVWIIMDHKVKVRAVTLETVLLDFEPSSDGQYSIVAESICQLL